MTFSLREMTAADSPAIVALTDQSPDGGMISFSLKFHVPPFEVYASQHGGATATAGVVATVENVAGIVGAARVTFGECQFEGSVRPYALLSSLMVHPDYRRRGIAAALAKWRIDRVIEHSGGDTVILADIQTGNTGSTVNAKKWANQIMGRIVTAPASMRTRPPRVNDEIAVREATRDELEQIAASVNTFYSGYNFYRPQTAERLREWLESSPLTTPVNHYLVAVDRSNRMLAGMGIREEGRLMSLFIGKVPPLIRLVNLILRVVPTDGSMRNLRVENLWFVPGQLEAARYLWQSIRWEWRDRASNLLCTFDPRSPIKQVIQNPPWMPTTTVSVAVRAPVSMSEERLIDPLI